ncbi:alpha/beta fold hydrolase [Pseudoclavibacter helvolus]
MRSLGRASGRLASGVDPVAGLLQWTSASGQASRLRVPSGYSDVEPAPLVVWCHGVGNSAATPGAYTDPLSTAGALLGSSHMHGDSYGNAASLNDLYDVVAHAVANAAISGVVLVGNSMGGVAALNALTRNVLPSIIGVYLTDPVVSLRQRYDNGRAAEINAAFDLANASEYAAKTAGFDPALAGASAFAGVPIRVLASSGDTSVPLISHGAVLQEKLGGQVELTDLGTAGHNTPDRFDGADLVSFIRRCVGGSIGMPGGI